MIPARVSGLLFVSSRVAWARRWYEGLGWRSQRSDQTFVPYPLAGTAFALWSLDSAAASVAAVAAATGRFPGSLLSLVVDTPEEVDAGLDAVAAAGAEVVVPAATQPFGRAGWFVDPEGTTWEISSISGRDAVAPFPGAPAEAAVATTLGAVTVRTTNPAGSLEFYAQGLGWAGRATSWADRPALVTDGAVLAFAPPDELHPPGEHGAFMVAAEADVGTLRDTLLQTGATALTTTVPLPGGGRLASVADPNGLIWELVYDPRWVSTPGGSEPRPASAAAAAGSSPSR